MSKQKLRPVLDGDYWMIGDNPDLGGLQGNTDRARGGVQECVDHHVFQSPDGAWHLWGCIRNCAVVRILYHWEGESLTQRHWRQTGEVMRVDRSVGECLNGKPAECIQSPFVVSEGGLFYMFYGTSPAGTDEEGRTVAPGSESMAGQMCLATSKDGRSWTRHRDAGGQSRVFVGPSSVRDPALIKIGGLWYLYYAGYHDQRRNNPGFYLRTSEDLVHWSDWSLVHQDFRYGAGPWNTECPHVVERAGYYYLFRTQDYASSSTHVFRSDDPRDFGIGDAQAKYVGRFPAAAPEIILDAEGNEYITSNHNLQGGTMLCRLKWVED